MQRVTTSSVSAATQPQAASPHTAAPAPTKRPLLPHEGPFDPHPHWPHNVPRPSAGRIALYVLLLFLSVVVGAGAVWFMLEHTAPAVRQAEREAAREHKRVPLPQPDGRPDHIQLPCLFEV